MVSENRMSLPSADFAMTGMSPIMEHLVTCPLADEKISSHGRVLTSRLQSLVLLAVQPESGIAAKEATLNVSPRLASALSSASCKVLEVDSLLSAACVRGELWSLRSAPHGNHAPR